VSEVQHFMAANGVWPTDGALAVVHRYLTRHRRRRHQGGMVGLLVYVVLVVELLQRFIAERPRPALPDDLRRADDAIRRASSAVALPHAGLGLVLLFLGLQVAPALGSTLVAVIAALALLVGAIVQWRRSRVWVVRPQPGVGFGQPAVQP
jgi:hypothetical protein